MKIKPNLNIPYFKEVIAEVLLPAENGPGCSNAPTTSHGKTFQRNTWKVFFAVILAGAGGCGLVTPSVITTEIEKTEHGFRVISPKDTVIKGLKITKDGLTVKEYRAKANSDAVQSASAEAGQRAVLIGKVAEAAAAALGR